MESDVKAFRLADLDEYGCPNPDCQSRDANILDTLRWNEKSDKVLQCPNCGATYIGVKTGSESSIPYPRGGEYVYPRVEQYPVLCSPKAVI